jgi:glycosyltransferase involved in cell wall biosynthesis
MTIGNFRHAPNWDAVLYLQKIWPLIRKQLPKAELHIYGSYPPPKATALNNPKTGFLIKGWADNAYDVMQSARVCLAPLRFGAGIKGKLLEAMIMQTPSVTTRIGIEGMHNDLPWPGKVANNTEDFANAAVELYNSQTDFKHAQQAGNALLNSVYDKVKLSAALINKIDLISNDLSAHREKNFTGQMLKHHTMRSTQYMAQWIAEKNKKLD